MPKIFQMTEDRVAGQLGVSRDRMKEIRETRLLMGAHYSKNGAAIVYTSEGVDAAVAAMKDDAQQAVRDVHGQPDGLLEPVLPPPDTKPVLTAATPQNAMLRVTNTYPNEHWVQARTEGGIVVKCWVRSNLGMRRGTILRNCELQADGRYLRRGNR